MSALALSIMAALGIGGGFAILASEWFRDERRLRRARARCRFYRVCNYSIFGLPGVEREPNWRWIRFAKECAAFSNRLAASIRELSAKVAECNQAIAALQVTMNDVGSASLRPMASQPTGESGQSGLRTDDGRVHGAHS